MLKKLSMSILTIVLGAGIESSYSGYGQVGHVVQTCLNINSDNSPYSFVNTMVLKDDMITDYFVSPAFKKGRQCLISTRRHPFIRAYLGVKASSVPGILNTHITLDSSCRFLHATQSGAVTSWPITVPHLEFQSWQFILTQLPATKEFKYNFKLECTRE